MQKGPPQAYVEHLIRRVLECVACPRLCATQISIIHAHSTSQLVYSIITHTRQTRSSQKLRVRPPTHTTTTKHTEENPSKMYCTVFFLSAPSRVRVCFCIDQRRCARARTPASRQESIPGANRGLPSRRRLVWLALGRVRGSRPANANTPSCYKCNTSSTTRRDDCVDPQPRFNLRCPAQFALNIEIISSPTSNPSPPTHTARPSPDQTSECTCTPV